MSSKTQNSGDHENFPKEKTPSHDELSAQESSKNDADSTGSKSASSAPVSLSPKKEEGENEIESDQEQENTVPTKRGKKTKSSQFLVGFCLDIAWCKKSKWNELLKILKFQNWLKIVSIDEGLYEKEMKAFCSGFTITKGVCVSIVNGSVVTITEKKLGGMINFEREETPVKVEVRSKRKLDEEGVPSGSVRKSQRLAGSKFQNEQDQGDTLFIHLDSDPVPSTAMDFPLLSTTGLNKLLREIQDSLTLLHTRINAIEATVNVLDSQQQQQMLAIKNADTGIRNKVDGVLFKIDYVVSSLFKRTKP
ncbi:hypothetical protein BVRB_2g047070 [Beta vulgaris subsp. vulgaris]|uniref:Uncharacterized protein n=1 Tax=Beta vulgaris subsp. vulgaris TaxID=3555 RepID=A0A0J8BGL1_BETVV|nr:hypothetical protein BVRB_2g047070 [Beta vulgaris subsp. vulgaris]